MTSKLSNMKMGSVRQDVAENAARHSHVEKYLMSKQCGEIMQRYFSASSRRFISYKYFHSPVDGTYNPNENQLMSYKENSHGHNCNDR